MEEGTVGVHLMALSGALGFKGGLLRSPSSSAGPPPPRTVFPTVRAGRLSSDLTLIVNSGFQDIGYFIPNKSMKAGIASQLSSEGHCLPL